MNICERPFWIWRSFSNTDIYLSHFRQSIHKLCFENQKTKCIVRGQKYVLDFSRNKMSLFYVEVKKDSKRVHRTSHQSQNGFTWETELEWIQMWLYKERYTTWREQCQSQKIASVSLHLFISSFWFYFPNHFSSILYKVYAMTTKLLQILW